MPDYSALPDWPRALRAPLAAAYLGVSAGAFRDHIAGSIKPCQITPGIKVYLRDDLDLFLDRQAGHVAASQDSNPWPV